MRTPVHGKAASRGIGVALALWALAGSMASGDDGPAVATQKNPKWGKHFLKRKPTTQGTLGYGPPGLHPGFQGFGLGYHPGYGYGGDALGVGAEGGYPFYGGPGYPHPAPCLRRLGPIIPFAYNGGPGGPSPEQSNFFGGVGPLAPDQPVVTFENDPGMLDYGCFTGSIPYPESTFAPFATQLGESTNEARPPIPAAPANSPPIPPTTPETPDASRSFGMSLEIAVDASSARGLKITRLQPGGVAEKAGLEVGDVIRSANGYLTEQPGNLTWIMINATPETIVTFNVLSAKTGEVRTITARRP
jgi:PDZ domain